MACKNSNSNTPCTNTNKGNNGYLIIIILYILLAIIIGGTLFY